MSIKPRPSIRDFDVNSGGFVEIPKNETITYVTPYMPFRHPKWQFWKKNKYYLAVVTRNKLYLVDPETPSVTEATHGQYPKT